MERGNVNAYFQGLADDFLKTLGKRMRDETLNSGSIGSQGPRNGRAAVRDQVKLEYRAQIMWTRTACDRATVQVVLLPSLLQIPLIVGN